ncbi:MAG: hypothetical protein GY790_19800 [Bacteroidetes bacterium]|nr:hypothetical protein [Bacteroidota bacterium]
MNTIQIPEGELNEMKEFYLEEYEKSTSRLLHITSVLKRLGVDLPAEGSEPVRVKKTGTRKKPGRKSKWELVIMKRMRQLDKPVTYDQLTDEIMAFTRISPEKRSATKQAVVNVIFRLRNRDRKLDTFSMGTREKYIALKSWFDGPGKIKKEYAAKVKIAGKTKKAKKGKVGRPRKVSKVASKQGSK